LDGATYSGLPGGAREWRVVDVCAVSVVRPSPAALCLVARGLRRLLRFAAFCILACPISTRFLRDPRMWQVGYVLAGVYLVGRAGARLHPEPF